MRCFIALSLPEETMDYVKRICEDLSRYVEGDFVPEDNLHITLDFLGEIALSDKDKVIDTVFRAVKGLKPCDISLQKFILLNKGSVAALEIKKNDALLRLQKSITDALTEAGFSVDLKPFRPHVTVARRIKYEMPYREICKVLTIYNRPHFARDVVFYCSTLRREGAIYEPLQCFTLEN